MHKYSIPSDFCTTLHQFDKQPNDQHILIDQSSQRETQQNQFGRVSYRHTQSSRTAEVPLSYTHTSRCPSLGSPGAAGRPRLHSNDRTRAQARSRLLNRNTRALHPARARAQSGAWTFGTQVYNVNSYQCCSDPKKQVIWDT